MSLSHSIPFLDNFLFLKTRKNKGGGKSVDKRNRTWSRPRFAVSAHNRSKAQATPPDKAAAQISETTGFSGNNITAATGQCSRRIFDRNLKAKVPERKIGVEMELKERETGVNRERKVGELSGKRGPNDPTDERNRN